MDDMRYSGYTTQGPADCGPHPILSAVNNSAENLVGGNPATREERCRLIMEVACESSRSASYGHHVRCFVFCVGDMLPVFSCAEERVRDSNLGAGLHYIC